MVVQQSTNGGLRELALFAGAGGGILGGKLLGWRTVCAVERDAYAAQILAQRQNDGILEAFPIWSDVCSFDGSPWRGIVDVVSGGFPCQDISSAGKGAGIEGDRSGMWKEMARIIGEVRPKYAFVENSPMLTTRGLGVVLADLAALGFDAEWGVLSAADVGANHQRERMWIVGYSNNDGQTAAKVRTSLNERSNDSSAREKQTSELEGSSQQHAELANTEKLQRNGGTIHEQNIGTQALEFRGCSCKTDVPNSNKTQSVRLSSGTPQEIASLGICGENVIPNTSSIGQPRQGKSIKWRSKAQDRDWQTSIFKSISERSQWGAEPNVGRVANGVAFRVDRLKAIGNGQVPLCAATAFELLRERLEA